MAERCMLGHRCLRIVAGEQGFEPQLPDPESGVLPLDDSPSPLCDE